MLQAEPGRAPVTYARTMDPYAAPTGAIWVCSACGKTSAHRIDGPRGSLWDASCYVHAVLCFNDDTLKLDARGRVCAAKAYPPAETDP